MDVPPTLERWSAACLALEDEVRRVLDLREELLASRVRAVERLASPLLDGAWLDGLLGTLEQVETLRHVLEGILGRLERGDYYDVDALRAAALSEVGGRSRDEHLAALLERLAAPRERTASPLFACHVAGTTFRSLERVTRADGSVALAAAEDELAIGDELRFEREPSNRHDPSAVRVLTLTERWLGYVPRTRSDVVAALLDAGKEIGAFVEGVHRHARGWLEVRMTVCLFEPSYRVE